MKLFCTCNSAAECRNPIYLVMKLFLKWYIIIGFLVRIVLLFTSPADASFSVIDILRLVGIGVLSDVGMGLLLTLPLVAIYLGLNEWKYNKVAGWVIEALLAGTLVYISFFHTIVQEYGGSLPLIAKLLVGWKLLSFTLRFFIPRIRDAWRKASIYFTWMLYVFLMLNVAVGEFFFWQEFGVRYNFIAVDYLVYTHEVIGNIMESYAIVPLTAIIAVLTAGIIVWETRHRSLRINALYTPKLLLVHLAIYAVLCLGAWGMCRLTYGLQGSNQYVTQLEQNGAYDFVRAFQSNKLEYDKFYALLPEQECIGQYRQLAGLDAQGNKVVGDSTGTTRPNIVLITVESLSADYLTRYGNKQGITPYLDQLMAKSLVFDSLFANGNRTVRGLEALSLCLPPSAGESIVKRQENKMGNLSVGSVLKKMGYRAQFLYGGDSYFDNMGDFFSHNGYEIVDRKSIQPRDITFSNVWGVCDEDIFHKSLQVFDDDARGGKPFFAQIMTTSNHRPFTYPAGKIAFEGDPHCREAAVKYTDYAIGSFIREASRKPWFKNTVFVVIADHCASSAGKTSLPLHRYHIPCIVYAPELIKPGQVGTLCSQIDVVPTLLSRLGMRCQVGFTGQDVFSPHYKPRAFVATYQDLGYISNGKLTVLSPVGRIAQYSIKPLPDGTFEQKTVTEYDMKAVKEAQAYYQYANLYQKARR